MLKQTDNDDTDGKVLIFLPGKSREQVNRALHMNNRVNRTSKHRTE